MLEYLGHINLLLGEYLIKGLFISVLLIILIRLLFRNKIETDVSTQITRWIIIICAFIDLATVVLSSIFSPSDTSTFLSRATGEYWYSYWIMIAMNYVAPFLLLHKKIGKNITILLIISFMMNIGWLFEAYVIHVTSMHRDYGMEGFNPYLPTRVEMQIILNGLIIGILSLIIGNGIKRVIR